MVRHAAAAGGSVPASPGCGCSAISSFCFHEQDSRSERVTMDQVVNWLVLVMLRVSRWMDGQEDQCHEKGEMGELTCYPRHGW
uniref:Uncharacterized protein n=1 Tax=Leersia perrieri TaxID=77586 RepID=A0A0D9WQB9_9ORYZ